MQNVKTDGIALLILAAKALKKTVYSVTWTDIHSVHRLREFLSVHAFDGYVREARLLGVEVVFTSLTSAVAVLKK